MDVGLLRRLEQLAPTAFGEGNRLFTEFKGALTENFVLQTLITQFEGTPRYWTQTNPPYEVDFLIQWKNDIFPVEVKSEANTTSRSLKKFKELFPNQVKLRVRFSLDNLKLVAEYPAVYGRSDRSVDWDCTGTKEGIKQEIAQNAFLVLTKQSLGHI